MESGCPMSLRALEILSLHISQPQQWPQLLAATAEAAATAAAT